MNRITLKNYTATIKLSEYNDSPIDWSTPDDRGAWFALKHKQYNLPFESGLDTSDYDSWIDFAKAFKKETKTKIIKYIHCVDHGGLYINLQDSPAIHDRFDGGILGVIVGNSDDDINASFTDYKMYVEGDVWNITITKTCDCDCENCNTDVTIDSLAEVYGYNEAIKEANSMLEEAVKNNE